jgi:hypothetical protein
MGNIMNFDSFKPTKPKAKKENKVELKEDDKLGVEQAKTTTKDVTMVLLFGNDQVEHIDEVLEDLKKQENPAVGYAYVKSYNKEEAAGGHTKYTILFGDAYGVYLFGHTQGSTNPLA